MHRAPSPLFLLQAPWRLSLPMCLVYFGKNLPHIGIGVPFAISIPYNLELDFWTSYHTSQSKNARVSYPSRMLHLWKIFQHLPQMFIQMLTWSMWASLFTTLFSASGARWNWHKCSRTSSATAAWRGAPPCGSKECKCYMLLMPGDWRRLGVTVFFRFLPVFFRVIHGVVHSINGKDSVETVIAEIAMKKGNARAKYFVCLPVLPQVFVFIMSRVKRCL